jgi:hypothetical protein
MTRFLPGFATALIAVLVFCFAAFGGPETLMPAAASACLDAPVKVERPAVLLCDQDEGLVAAKAH